MDLARRGAGRYKCVRLRGYSAAVASPLVAERELGGRSLLPQSICVNRADYCCGAPAHSNDAAAQEVHSAGAKGSPSKSIHVALAAGERGFAVATRFADLKHSADASSTDVTRWAEN
jgi:hypothetical protein